MSFAQGASELVGMKLVALCDQWKSKLAEAGKQFQVATYTDYDKFLEHDMDAVVLANYFHQHAPFAIKALRAGKHVMSETSCNATLAEGVALCREVERTGLTYMLAENYPFWKVNMEMRRVYRTGEIGRVSYAEGEYNHPASPAELLHLSPGFKHWRNWIPSTYYCTHALAPLMYITDTMPVKINGLSIAIPELNKDLPRYNDPGSVILCRMDNGAVFRIFGLWNPGHSCWYRAHGTQGAMEIVRHNGNLRVWRDQWTLKAGEQAERVYQPDWPEYAELANKAGHGGGDFWTNFYFAKAIRTGKQPFLDVYRGVAMSSVGILAWKSALEDGAPFEMPDFRKESSRKKYANDHWSPWPDGVGDGKAPPSILGTHRLSIKARKAALKAWRQMRLASAGKTDKWVSPFVPEWRVSKVLKRPARGLAAARAARLSDSALEWKAVLADSGGSSPGFVNVHNLRTNSDGIVWAACQVRVPRDGAWEIRLGHDGGARLFVDGSEVLRQLRRVNPAPVDRTKRVCRLSKGTHVLLVALDTDGGMGWGFFLRFAIPKGRQKPRVKPVFPEPVDRA
jgi:predicted dehydrogenase